VQRLRACSLVSAIPAIALGLVIVIPSVAKARDGVGGHSVSVISHAGRIGASRFVSGDFVSHGFASRRFVGTVRSRDSARATFGGAVVAPFDTTEDTRFGMTEFFPFGTIAPPPSYTPVQLPPVQPVGTAVQVWHRDGDRWRLQASEHTIQTWWLDEGGNWRPGEEAASTD
jgi:hypothetical protein